MADDKQMDTKGVAGTAGGGLAGALAGAGIGAAIGGPGGLAVGAGIGGFVGSIAGGVIDYEAHEPEIRKHHESNPAFVARHPWEHAAPAYRYGWEIHDNPAFQGKTYDKIRPELHKGWTGSSDFVDYEDYVKHGWERRAASKEAGSFSLAAKE
jgi:uncharacterized protein YcfJ